MTILRRYPIGAELRPEGVHFRVWAPDRSSICVVFSEERRHFLEAEDRGYFSGLVKNIGPGSLYRLQLDGKEAVSDPASRFQPDGPHGPSAVVDPRAFAWTDREWKGPELDTLVIYELHIGTFTAEGTWTAAARELPELAAIGITCLEVMPLGDFAGEFGWGYDGVNLFAPTRLYGTPDDFRRFVDQAHTHGIAVLLDVVYNHLGPDGNYLKRFASAYFTDRHQTDWGEALNFDGKDSGPVREYFLSNAAYWIDEFHLDGLRLDATQNINDSSPAETHIFTEIVRHARGAAPGRRIIIVAENEPQHAELCLPIEQGGNGIDALWNDDFHHSAMVALSGHREAYYTDYLGTPQEFISAAKYGYLYQGQWYSWQSQRRGHSATELPLTAFINFLQNHDQVANSGTGARAHQLASPGKYRALTAWQLLMPGIPMLFQGQEFAASTPFLFFADHKPDLAAAVQAGRAEFLSQFRSLQDEPAQAQLAAPHDPQTFLRSKLDLSERTTHITEYQLTKDLLKLRQSDRAFHARHRSQVDGAVLNEQAFVLRYFSEEQFADRLVIVNLGTDLHLPIVPEPLLAPPANSKWKLALSTEEPQYGGRGISPVETENEGWRIPGEAAVILAAEKPGDVSH